MPSETLHATSHATTHPRTEVRRIRHRHGEPRASRRRPTRSAAPPAHLTDMSNHTIATPGPSSAAATRGPQPGRGRRPADPGPADRRPCDRGRHHPRHPRRPPSPDPPATVPPRLRRRRRGCGMTARRKPSAAGRAARERGTGSITSYRTKAGLRRRFDPSAHRSGPPRGRQPGHFPRRVHQLRRGRRRAHRPARGPDPDGPTVRRCRRGVGRHWQHTPNAPTREHSSGRRVRLHPRHCRCAQTWAQWTFARLRPVRVEAATTRIAAQAMATIQRTQSMPSLPLPPKAR
jgi:hypothetical protein